MTEKPDNACPACGVELPETPLARARRFCSDCASQHETPVGEPSLRDTIAPAAANQADLVERTLSVRYESSLVDSAAEQIAANLPERIGRFEIKALLGRGGFGTVYRAHDSLLDREVALKVPRLVDNDQSGYDRFLREAKAAARLVPSSVPSGDQLRS